MIQKDKQNFIFSMNLIIAMLTGRNTLRRQNIYHQTNLFGIKESFYVYQNINFTSSLIHILIIMVVKSLGTDQCFMLNKRREKNKTRERSCTFISPLEEWKVIEISVRVNIIWISTYSRSGVHCHPSAPHHSMNTVCTPC